VAHRPQGHALREQYKKPASYKRRLLRITQKWSRFQIENYQNSSDKTFNTEIRQQMMKVSAIVNEIDENFETNDSFPAR
jgi:hypothetical protein